MHKITSFVIIESGKTLKGKEVALSPQIKSAPHYFSKSVPVQHILSQDKGETNGRKISIAIKTYHPHAIIVEASMVVKDIFSEDVFRLKEQLIEECYKRANKKGDRQELSEEYTLYQVFGYQGDPYKILSSRQNQIVSLLKSEKLKLSQKEIEHTLSFQFNYAKDDLVILDWDGAFVFDPEGDVGQLLELLELANYQLLRYRILDKKLDENLKRAYRLTETKSGKWFRTREVAAAFKEVIKIRAKSIAYFDAIERDIKLIGEWYSARVYDLISKKIRLEGWRTVIKEKLESLEDIYTIVSENLGASKVQVLELIQIVAFFILQLGWFVLIILEFMYFTR